MQIEEILKKNTALISRKMQQEHGMHNYYS